MWNLMQAERVVERKLRQRNLRPSQTWPVSSLEAVGPGVAGQGARVLDAEERAGVAKGRLEFEAAVGEDPLLRHRRIVRGQTPNRRPAAVGPCCRAKSRTISGVASAAGTASGP